MYVNGAPKENEKKHACSHRKTSQFHMCDYNMSLQCSVESVKVCIS